MELTVPNRPDVTGETRQPDDPHQLVWVAIPAGVLDALAEAGDLTTALTAHEPETPPHRALTDRLDQLFAEADELIEHTAVAVGEPPAQPGDTETTAVKDDQLMTRSEAATYARCLGADGDPTDRFHRAVRDNLGAARKKVWRTEIDQLIQDGKL